MVQVPVFYGEWVLRDWKWHFEVDYGKGGRMFSLTDACSHRELFEMARDDYSLVDCIDAIELTYMLPEEMLEVWDKDCPTPPIKVTNDRHVRSFLELRKTHCVRLCVSTRIAKVSQSDEVVGKVNENDIKESDDESFEGNHEYDSDELDEEDMVLSDNDDGVGLVKDEDVEQESVMKEEYYDDYSLYGKLKDEDSSDSDDDVKPFLGAEQSYIGEGRRPSMTWTDGISLHKIFPSKDALKSELHVTAIMGQFAFKIYKSKPNLFLAKCRVGGCTWRVRAMVQNEPNAFCVTVYRNLHTCHITQRVALKKRYAPKYIAKLFHQEWKTIDGVTPEMLRSVLDGKFGLTMNYTTSYRALLLAQQMVRGTSEEGYEQLHAYLHRVAFANPGTVTDLVVDSENRFKYMFFCLGASKEGFQYLRRVMVVDGCHLHGKYGGVLLVACGQDGNFQIFPLAFAIVDSENDESWAWFFTKLSTCVSSEYALTVISDRHASIKKAIETVMPWATRGICYYHLQNNIVTKFRGKPLLYLVRGAAYAYTHADYERNMNSIRATKPDLADYLEAADVRLWARIHFQGLRYNIQTSNIAESLNSAFKKARGFPLPYLVEFIREKLARWYYKRREDAMSLTTPHSRGVETLLSIRGYFAQFMGVQRIDQWRFNVTGSEQKTFLVDLLQRTCDCGMFQIEKIPCSHAIAAAPHAQTAISSLVCPSYTRDYLFASYAGNIYPPNRDVKVPEFDKVEPPLIRRPPGRQKKSRWQSWFEIASKTKDKPRKAHKQYSCSKCKQPGHTRPHCVS